MKTIDLKNLFNALADLRSETNFIADALNHRCNPSKSDMSRIAKECVKALDIATKLKYQK